MEGLIGSLGKGICDSVAYDTAWVARVPQGDKPAFPECLQWLRENQLEDGSWGTNIPISYHGNTISTLIAVIALKEMGNDYQLIENGLKSLHNMYPQLDYEFHEGAGFEIIIINLIQRCRELKLDIPNYDTKEGEKKLAYVKKSNYDKPATWWFSLEMFGDDLIFNDKVITPNGSVALSPSATAYVLRHFRLKGEDKPELENYLRGIIKNGGVPDHAPIDLFELSFGLDYLMKAGVPLSLLRTKIDELYQNWDDENGIGFSKHWKISDADDTAIAIHVLKQAGYTISNKSLMKFFNGKCIQGYPGEKTHSISVNVNALKALDHNNEIINWLNEQKWDNDKWNVSPYYVASRAVFIPSLAERAMKMLSVATTLEENCYVVLALCHWMHLGNEVDEQLLTIFPDVRRKNSIMKDTDKVPLWCAKVLYCPSIIRDCIIAGARYALDNLNGSLRIKLTDSNKIYSGILHTFLPSRKINFDVSGLVEIASKILSKFGSDKNSTIHDSVTSMMYTMYQGDKFREIELKMYLVVFIYDVIIDKGFEKMKDKSDDVAIAFEVFVKILKGIKVDKTVNFPKFNLICELLVEIRLGLENCGGDLNLFEYGVEQYHKGYIIKFLNRVNNIVLSTEEHLKVASMTYAVHMFCGMHYVFGSIIVDDNKYFIEFREKAYTVGRLIGDLFSFMKDLRGCKTDNYVLIKAIETNDEIAFRHTLDFCNSLILEMKHLEGKCGNADAVMIFKQMIQGITDWCSISPRYQIDGITINAERIFIKD